MKVIITGSTGMVGEGVMLVCLEHPQISEVLVINRKPIANKHPKLKELIVKDFSTIGDFRASLTNYDACFFCAGVSSIRHTEESFTKATFDFVIPFAKSLSSINPNMTFTYVSGSGTDSTEQGKVMWARVKGRTENTLLTLPFKQVYNFLPGFMKPVKGQQNLLSFYRYLGFLTPLFMLVFPKWSCTLNEVALAMINCVSRGYTSSTLEVVDIKSQANP